MWAARQNESFDDGVEPSEIRSKPFSFLSDSTSGFKFCKPRVSSSFPFFNDRVLNVSFQSVFHPKVPKANSGVKAKIRSLKIQ